MTALPSFFIVKCKWHPVVAPFVGFPFWVFIWISNNIINVFWTNICNNTVIWYWLSYWINKIRWYMTVWCCGVSTLNCNWISTCTFESVWILSFQGNIHKLVFLLVLQYQFLSVTKMHLKLVKFFFQIWRLYYDSLGVAKEIDLRVCLMLDWYFQLDIWLWILK